MCVQLGRGKLFQVTASNSSKVILFYGTLKKPKWSWEITSWFIRKRERKNACWARGCFLPKSRYHSITLENYSNVKNESLFNKDIILKINDYYNNRSSGSVSFTESCEIINSLSNQDFAGLGKFRWRASLGKIKEMHAKICEVLWVTFLVHIFLQ